MNALPGCLPRRAAAENNQNFSPNPPFQSTDYQTQSTGYQTQAPPPPPAPEAPGDPGVAKHRQDPGHHFRIQHAGLRAALRELEETLRKESSDIRDTTRRHLEALEALCSQRTRGARRPAECRAR